MHGFNFLSRLNNREFQETKLKFAALRGVPIKALRHTFASLLLGQGESLPYVRDQMGHSSIQVTVDVYRHLISGRNRAAVDRLDDLPIGATTRNHQSRVRS